MRLIAAEPLRGVIIERIAQNPPTRHPQAFSGRNALARQYVDRYGGDIKAAHRWLSRMHQGEIRNVTVDTADRWLTLMGLHLDIVYGEQT